MNMSSRQSQKRGTNKASKRKGAVSHQSLSPNMNNNQVRDVMESPQWVSGSDVVFKTPSSWSPMKTRRRTTMLQEEITATQNKVLIGKRSKLQMNEEQFKIPSLMFSSPPGVKTRNRRASILVAASKDSKETSLTKHTKKTTRKKNMAAKQTETVVKRAGRTTVSKASQSKLTSEKVVLSSVLSEEEDENTVARVAEKAQKRTKKEDEGFEKISTNITLKRKSSKHDESLKTFTPRSMLNNESDISEKKSRKSLKRKSVASEKSEIANPQPEQVFTQIKDGLIEKQTPQRVSKIAVSSLTVTAEKQKITRSVRSTIQKFSPLGTTDLNTRTTTPGKVTTPSRFNTPKVNLKEKLSQDFAVGLENIDTFNSSSVAETNQTEEAIFEEPEIQDMPPVSPDVTLNSTDLNLTLSRSSSSRWCTIL